MCQSFRDTEEKIRKYTVGFNHEDLKHFEPYVKRFKMQGREFHTPYIICQLLHLLGNSQHMQYIKHDEEWFNSAITDGIIKLL